MSARIAWQHGHFPGRPHCETPRHRGQQLPAQWSMAVVIPQEPNVVQSACDACMRKMASDLGTTPEQGAVRG